MEHNTFSVTDSAGPAYRPHIYWQGGYRLVKLRESGSPLPFPWQDLILKGDELKNQPLVLVFGERGGGTRNFLGWLQKTLAAQHWLLLRAAEPGGVFCDWSPALAGTEAEPSASARTAESAIQKFVTTPGAVAKTEALSQWANRLPSLFTLIIRDLSALGQPAALEAAAALRRLLEQPVRPRHLRVLITDSSEEIYLDRPDRSGLVSVADQYRLPSLRRTEIQALAQWPSEGPDRPHDRPWHRQELADPALNRVMTFTGGQPLLVQCLVAGLQSAGPGAVADNQIAHESRRLHLSPPDETRFWQRDLRALLAQEPSLWQALEAYLLGKSLGPARFPPPSAERALFIAGWVKLDEQGRWGIASQFHAHLAREVLHSLGRKTQ